MVLFFEVKNVEQFWKFQIAGFMLAANGRPGRAR